MGDPDTAAGLRASAAQLWRSGHAADAIARMRQAIDREDSAPGTAAFLQLAGYYFHDLQFQRAVAVLMEAAERYPDDRSILMHLGGTLARANRSGEARLYLERLAALGPLDEHGCDALAMVMADTGDREQARLYGSQALRLKDEATASRRGTIALRAGNPASNRKVIAFTLFGSNPRYLRGALLNVLEARRLLPGWTCRFYVDETVDSALIAVLGEEGAQIVAAGHADGDRRRLLARRFLVNDDPQVGYFLVRDCDSVLGEREVGAIAEWVASAIPFHAIRDWYTHTDLMLAGLWGGIAGVYPDMAKAIADYEARAPLTSNWDQHFLRDMVWPSIRDSILVHDRLFSGHGVRPLAAPAAATDEHIGQNEFNGGKTRQAAPFAAFAERVPALGFAVRR